MQSSLMALVYMHSSKLKTEIENFASAAVEIMKSDNEDFGFNIKTGIKLVRGACMILSLLNVGNPVASCAHLILSIGMAAFNMKEEPNIDCVVKSILGQEKDQEMTNECEGARSVLVSSTKFLCGIGIRELAPHEISSLSANVPINAGVNLIGKLASIIKDLLIKTCQIYFNGRKQKYFDGLKNM